MIRVMTYNILAGGTNRAEPLAQVLEARQPDLIGLIEASDDQIVQHLSRRLGTDYRLSASAKAKSSQPVAILSRLPILETYNYRPHSSSMPPLLGVQVAKPDGAPLIVLVTHLTAGFNTGWLGAWQRYQETRTLLKQMQPYQGTPHLLMGDFNTVAPGDSIKGSALLRYLTDEQLYYQLIPAPEKPARPAGLPGLDSVLPRWLRFAHPFLRAIPDSSVLSGLLDLFQWLYAPRGGIGLLRKAGYVDVFRRLHPKEPGWTWPSALPAGRIDYLFASPELAPSLDACEVLLESKGVPVSRASDHLPVLATLQV